MFEKFNNNSSFNRQRSITTNYQTFFGNDSKLTLAGWNDRLSIKIAPTKGMNPDGLRMYASDISEILTTAFSKEAAISLLEGIAAKIIPALENKENASVGIITGVNENQKVVQIELIDNTIKLKVNTKLNEEGQCGEDSIYAYTFTARDYSDGYSCSEGFINRQSVQAEFKLFCKILEEFSSSSGVSVQIEKFRKSFSYQGQNNYGSPLVAANSNYQSIGSQNTNANTDAPSHNFSGEISEFLPFN